MDERRKVISIRQHELMLEFLEGQRDLALGMRSKEGRALAERLWSEYAEVLNAAGPPRTAKQWSKVWNDQKSRVRTKITSINTNQQATGGRPTSNLTPIEERVGNIIGFNVGPLPNVRQDQFQSNGDVVRANNSEEASIKDVNNSEEASIKKANNSEEASIKEANNSEESSIEEVINSQEAYIEEAINSQEAYIEEANDSTNDSPPLIVLHINGSPSQEELVPSPRPSITGYTSPTPCPSDNPKRRGNEVQDRRVVRRRRAGHTLRRPTEQPTSQSSRKALDDALLMMVKIGKMRAKTSLKMAEAALLIAQSIDWFSRKCCGQPEEQMDED